MVVLFSSVLTTVLPKKKAARKFDSIIKRRVRHCCFCSTLLQWWFMVGFYFYWERRETVFLFASLPLHTLAHTQWSTHSRSLCHAGRRGPHSGLPSPPPPRGPSLQCSLCNLLGFAGDTWRSQDLYIKYGNRLFASPPAFNNFSVYTTRCLFN